MSRSELTGRESSRTWVVIVAVVVVAALASIPFIGPRAQEWLTTLQDFAAVAPEARLEVQRSAAGSESLLVLVMDAEDQTRALALVTNPDADPGVLTLLPPGLFELLPGFGERPIAEATQFEGPALTALTVANALGVGVDSVLTLGPGELAAALPDAVTVELASAYVVTTDGSSQLVAETGPGSYGPEMVEQLLVDPGDSDPLEWLERQAAVWDAVLVAMAGDAAVTERISASAQDPALASGVLAATAANDPQVTLVPLQRSGGAGAVEGFTLDRSSVDAFVGDKMPHLAVGPRPRPRVEILNGNGRIGATRPVSEALVRDGFHVVITDNADRFDFEETLIIAQGSEQRGAADRALAAMGIGVVQVEPRAVSRVVDVGIIVGHDVPAGEG